MNPNHDTEERKLEGIEPGSGFCFQLGETKIMTINSNCSKV